jgi:hypothetical protein
MVSRLENWQKILLKCGADEGLSLQRGRNLEEKTDAKKEEVAGHRQLAMNESSNG